ncbi:MAG: amidase [Alphaproteobacteria bacterium]|nr:amidase [Alphaproteobacteria bacterium]
MDAEALCFLPAIELARLIRAKELTASELVAAILARIAALDPDINAFATLTADQALRAAAVADRDLQAAKAIGSLHGVPVTIKDLTQTAGIATEYGSHLRAGFVPELNAPLVTRLKQAGAIVIGKTTTSEFGWTGVSRSPLTGITHNPWRKGFSAGASSAGAGAAAAAGFGPLHQGSDGAGSIRMPAHFCGVFGFKSTYGRIPNWPLSNTDYTSHNAPMTRTVADAALMLGVVAGPHPWDHTSSEAAPPDYLGRLASDLRGRRIAFSPDLGHARVDPEIAGLVRDAAAAFAADLGADVEEVTPAWGRDGPELIRFFWPAHLSVHAPALAQWQDRMDPGLVACVRAGEGHRVVEYQQMRERKYSYCTAIHRFFEQWDLLLTPAVSVAAFPAERLQPEHWPQHDWDWISWAEFSYPFNLSGNPAASVPCGFTHDGLPVGLQIVARRFDDLGLLQAAAAFERARPWSHKRPPLGVAG